MARHLPASWSQCLLRGVPSPRHSVRAHGAPAGACSPQAASEALHQRAPAQPPSLSELSSTLRKARVRGGAHCPRTGVRSGPGSAPAPNPARAPVGEPMRSLSPPPPLGSTVNASLHRVSGRRALCHLCGRAGRIQRPSCRPPCPSSQLAHCPALWVPAQRWRWLEVWY